MGQKCMVCKLPPDKRKHIEKDFINGMNIHQLSKTYGMSEKSVQTHVTNHLPERLVSQAREQSAFDSSQLLKKINQVCNDLRTILDRNFAQNRDGTAIKAAKELRNTLQLLTQITMAIGKTKVEELEQEQKKQFKEVTEIPIEELSEGAQELLFEISNKQLEGMSYDITPAIEYPDVNEDQMPRFKRKRVDEEPKEPKASVGGLGIVEKNNMKKNTPPEPKPEYERHGMTFRPIPEWDGKTDPKVKLSRRKFSREIDSDNGQDPYSSPLT